MVVVALLHAAVDLGHLCHEDQRVVQGRVVRHDQGSRLAEPLRVRAADAGQTQQVVTLPAEDRGKQRHAEDDREHPAGDRIVAPQHYG